MQMIDLSGEWHLRQSGRPETLKTVVPGCVQTDLLAAGKIPDPFYRDVVVTLTAKAPAPWVWLELEGAEARFSDNFFHLVPGKLVSVTVQAEKPFSLWEIKKRLRVKSLIDTY